MVETVLFLGIICLFFFLPVSFHFYYQKIGKDDLLIMEMTFLHGLLKRRKVTSLIKRTPQGVHKHQKTSGRWFFFRRAEVKEENSSNQLNLEEPREFWRKYQLYGLGVTLLTYFLPAKYRHWLLVVESLEKRGRFEKFTWITRLGTGDSAKTSIIYGLLWGLKFGLLNVLQSKFKFRRKPELQVIPDYQQPKWDTIFDCIFQVKLGYIIIVALMARLRLQVLKGGVGIE